MLAEHTFVTVLEAQDVQLLLGDFLLQLGFRCDPKSPDVLEAHRGVTNLRKIKTATDSPLHVRVVFDRGRITAAAWVEESRRKFSSEHRQLILTILQSLEDLLVHAQSPQQARIACDSLFDSTSQAGLEDNRRRRNRALAIGIPIIAILLIILILVWSTV